jgi:hypothetical protein
MAGGGGYWLAFGWLPTLKLIGDWTGLSFRTQDQLYESYGTEGSLHECVCVVAEALAAAGLQMPTLADVVAVEDEQKRADLKKRHKHGCVVL